MSDNGPNRRRVLGSLGAGIAATATASGVGAATRGGAEAVTMRRTALAEAAVNDADLRRRLVEQHASETITTLVDRTAVSGASEFEFTTFKATKTRLSRDADWEGTAVISVTDDADGNMTQLMASTYVDQTHVRLFVRPEGDESYAMVNRPDTDGELVIADGTVVSSSDVTKSDCSGTCSDRSSCTNETCSGCTLDNRCSGTNTLEYLDCYFDTDCNCYCIVTGSACYGGTCPTDCGCG